MNYYHLLNGMKVHVYIAAEVTEPAATLELYNRQGQIETTNL